MADKELTIRVNVAGGAAGAQIVQHITNNFNTFNHTVGGATTIFNRFGNTFNRVTNSISRIGVGVFSALKNVLSGLVFQVLALAAAYGGLRAIMGAVAGQGMLEDQVRAVAAMIAMTTGDFKRALLTAKGYVSDLVDDAKKLPGEFQDFMAVTQAISGPMMTIGKGMSDIRKTVGQIAVASSIFGLRIEQTGTDIMRMMQGSAGLEQVFWRTLKAMNLITQSSEEFNKLAPVERYKLIANALEKISGDQDLLASVAASWTTETSTLKDNLFGVKGFMGQIGLILMNAILPRIAKVNEWFEKNSAAVSRIAKNIGGILADAIRALEAPTKALASAFISWMDHITQNRGEIAAFFDATARSAAVLVEIIAELAGKSELWNMAILPMLESASVGMIRLGGATRAVALGMEQIEAASLAALVASTGTIQQKLQALEAWSKASTRIALESSLNPARVEAEVAQMRALFAKLRDEARKQSLDIPNYQPEPGGETKSPLSLIPSAEQVASGFESLSTAIKSGMDKATGYIKEGWSVAASETGMAMERMRTAVVESQLAIAQEINTANEDSWNARMATTSEGLAALRDMEIQAMAERLEQLGLEKEMIEAFLAWKEGKYAEYFQKIKDKKKEEEEEQYIRDRANDEIGYWNRLGREIELTTTRVRDFQEGFREGMQKWTDSMLDFKARGVDVVKAALDTFADGVADAFMSIIDGSQTATEAFRNFAKQLIMMLIRSAIQLLINTMLAIALRSALGDPTAGGTAVANATSGMSALSALSATAASATPMDSGGVVRGPANIKQGNITEAHIPIPSGRVPVEIRNGGGMGNGPVNVAITINNPQDGADVQRVISSPEFGRAVKAHTINNLATSAKTRAATRSAASGRA